MCSVCDNRFAAAISFLFGYTLLIALDNNLMLFYVYSMYVIYADMLKSSGASSSLSTVIAGTVLYCNLPLHIDLSSIEHVQCDSDNCDYLISCIVVIRDFTHHL
jgi:hypothetical protein